MGSGEACLSEAFESKPKEQERTSHRKGGEAEAAAQGVGEQESSVAGQEQGQGQVLLFSA